MAAVPDLPRLPDVRIDWSGLARRAYQLTVPGTTIGGLTPAPEGHAVALTVGPACRRWPRCGRGGRRRRACTSSTSRAVQLTRVPPAPQARPGGRGGGGRGGGGGGLGGGGQMVFARDGRTLYFRSGTGLFAAAVNPNAVGAAGTGATAGGRGAGGRGGRGGAAATPEPRDTDGDRAGR